MTRPLGQSRGEWPSFISLHPRRPYSSHPHLITLTSVLDHDAAPFSFNICVSPDGRYLATGAFDGKIRVRGSPCRSLTNHLPLRPPLDSVLFPQHAQPAYTFSPHHPQIWDIATKRILCIFDGHEKPVISLDFSHDSRLIISGSWDNTLRIWDIETTQHEMLSITTQVDVRAIVTCHRLWHANACCVYWRCWRLCILYFVLPGSCIYVGRRQPVFCRHIPRWVPRCRRLL
jgi:WD40 repeat protein